MRQKIVAGNWKMNKTLQEANTLVAEVLGMVNDEVHSDVKVILCVPFPYLGQIKNQVGESNRIFVSAQNCNEHQSGAYTGEVSAAMLKSIGIPYVIIGHSERRQYFGEDDKMLGQKVDAAFANNLTPIFCCGESLVVREDNRHNDWVRTQLEQSLFHLPAEAIKKKQLSLTNPSGLSVPVRRLLRNKHKICTQSFAHTLLVNMEKRWLTMLAFCTGVV